LQYHHVGSVVVTVYAQNGGGTTVLFGFGLRSLSIPVARRLQGAAKLDWVTEWLFDMKMKCTRSPTAAETCGGV